MFFVLLFLSTGFAENCSMRTPTYVTHGPSNDNWWYFVPDTYGGGLAPSCTSVPSNDKYRDAVKKKYPVCVGQWCLNAATAASLHPTASPGSPSIIAPIRTPAPTTTPTKKRSLQSETGSVWSCLSGSQECYHVEHIIPRGNSIPELAECPTDIYGNLVMAYGKWNVQLGNKYFSEKNEIYGQLFADAYREVYKCCKGAYPAVVPVPDCRPAPTAPGAPVSDAPIAATGTLWYIPLAIFVVIVAVGYTAYHCRHRKSSESVAVD
jgi:hypothetical protein